MNFENFIEYLRKEKGYSSNTLIAYVNDLRQFEKVIKESCGVENETEVTSAMLRIWLVALKDKGVYKSSYAALSKMIYDGNIEEETDKEKKKQMAKELRTLAKYIGDGKQHIIGKWTATYEK